MHWARGRTWIAEMWVSPNDYSITKGWSSKWLRCTLILEGVYTEFYFCKGTFFVTSNPPSHSEILHSADSAGPPGHWSSRPLQERTLRVDPNPHTAEHWLHGPQALQETKIHCNYQFSVTDIANISKGQVKLLNKGMVSLCLNMWIWNHWGLH